MLDSTVKTRSKFIIISLLFLDRKKIESEVPANMKYIPIQSNSTDRTYNSNIMIIAIFSCSIMSYFEFVTSASCYIDRLFKQIHLFGLK